MTKQTFAKYIHILGTIALAFAFVYMLTGQMPHETWMPQLFLSWLR